jgi:hypothetical protein
MKKLAVLTSLALVLTSIGCGSSTTSPVKAADGTWESALVGTNAGVGVFNFLTSFSVGNNGALSVSYFSFLTTGPCFPVTGETVSGTFDVTSATTTLTSANFQFSVQSSDNSLTLTGTATGTTDTSSNTTWSTITGTWTQTGGSSCAGSGTFTMKRS